ncbi:hypothetical protein AVEN_249816-1 [Araneus ventricosus]|uniref:Uncharacterized protein n=1 Tax=Araneus ventricosus TaxID=182803 RepID=A0A4Y2RHT8_ARAVE|nr:hypothetical protein AVEN_249816-1 [Araneus ventricosus]
MHPAFSSASTTFSRCLTNVDQVDTGGQSVKECKGILGLTHIFSDHYCDCTSIPKIDFDETCIQPTLIREILYQIHRCDEPIPGDYRIASWWQQRFDPLVQNIVSRKCFRIESSVNLLKKFKDSLDIEAMIRSRIFKISRGGGQKKQPGKSHLSPAKASEVTRVTVITTLTVKLRVGS